MSLAAAAKASSPGDGMMGSSVLRDALPPYLMGGREDPYSADPNYMPPPPHLGRAELPVREDPYSMGAVARGGR